MKEGIGFSSETAHPSADIKTIWEKLGLKRQPWLTIVNLVNLPDPRRWALPACQRKVWLWRNPLDPEKTHLALASLSKRQNGLPPILSEDDPLRGIEEIIFRWIDGQITAMAQYPFSHISKLPKEIRGRIAEERYDRFSQGGRLGDPIELPLTLAQIESLIFHL